MPPPDRFVPMGDSLNFRNMGGYRTVDGAVTRDDMLFRSGWFDASGEEEARRFAACGIARIFDFRNEEERGRQPLVLPAGSATQVVELGINRGSMGPYIARIAGMDPAEVDCKSAMATMYYEMLDEAGDQYRRFLRGAVEADGPVMALCSTGKDRTGVASALLLTALGVPREEVLGDYLISADVYRGHEDNFARRHGYEQRGIPLDLVRDVFTVHPEYLAQIWRRAGEISGSMDGFLRDRLGVTEDDRRKLALKFTEQP